MKYILLTCIFCLLFIDLQATVDPIYNGLNEGKRSFFDLSMPSKVLGDVKTNLEFENTLFVDLLLGANNFVPASFNNFSGGFYAYNTGAVSIGARLGKKWYLGQIRKWQYGAQAAAKVGITLGFPFVTSFYTAGSVVLNTSITGGFINAINFNNKYGIEGNLNIGFNLMTSFLSYDYGTTGVIESATLIQPGFIFNPCVKFRIHSYAIGIDIAQFWGAPVPFNIRDNQGNVQTSNSGATVMTVVSLNLGKTF